MTLIQVILLLMILSLAVITIARFRVRFFATLIVCMVGATGIVFVLQPELSSVVARMLGVGRGADLVMYFGLLGLAFTIVMLYSKLRSVESRMTEIIRAVSIAQVEIPKSTDQRNDDDNGQHD